MKPFQRAQNRGTVSRPRLLFLVCVAVALGGRSASSSVSVVRREAVGRKWDSHLNTLRQSRVGLRPRDMPQVRAVAQKERRRDDETCTRGGVRRDGRDEGGKERHEKRVHGAPCLSMFSRRSGFAGYTWTTGTPFSFHSRSIVLRTRSKVRREAGYDRAESVETWSSAFPALRKGFLSCLQVHFNIVIEGFSFSMESFRLQRVG